MAPPFFCWGGAHTGVSRLTSAHCALSPEIVGNLTSDKDRAEPTSREVPTDAAGAAPVGNAVTGIDAVSLMSRAGARCVVKDDSSDVWWDMADSPAALNPCGTGTMTLSLVKTGGEVKRADL